MFVGLDDTDSMEGMCTTYLGALLCKKLGTTKTPKLIRLNPNIPYKTRGNGAIAFEAEGDREEIKKTVLSYVKRYSMLGDEKTNPGAVFIEKLGEKEKKVLRDFYRKTASELVTIKEAEVVGRLVGADLHKFKNGRGIIGALAAIGADLPDKTYEIVAYRRKKKGKRRIDAASVFRMDEETYPGTFNNIDHRTGRMLIAPRGYDPVYCGIRGESPRVVEKAWGMIKPLEEIEMVQTFVTNHGTDAHLRRKKIKEIKPYDCAIVGGMVSSDPAVIEGGHVFFGLEDKTGTIKCAVYKQSGDFRLNARKLREGDTVVAYGGISRHPGTLNLEKLEIKKLAKIFEKKIPVCCRKNMKSAGKGQGYRCARCGKKEKKAGKIEADRGLKVGFYEATAGARRHLSKPLVRMRPKGRRLWWAREARPLGASC